MPFERKMSTPLVDNSSPSQSLSLPKVDLAGHLDAYRGARQVMEVLAAVEERRVHRQRTVEVEGAHIEGTVEWSFQVCWPAGTVSTTSPPCRHRPYHPSSSV